MANLSRISIATLALAIWAHGFGAGLRGPALPWFLLSGFIGFGLGDMALFGALGRIGPRLSILLTQCLAAPTAAFVEWAWLGTSLHPAELICALLILLGVGIALAPDHGWTGSRTGFRIGVLFGIGSALGQASGAVLSRKAYAVAKAAQFEIDGGSAAYQRIVAGALVTALAFVLFKPMRSGIGEGHSRKWRPGIWLAIGNALAGPTLGVACYQWALKTDVRGSGIVLSIVATSPLVTILLAWLFEGQRPTRRGLSGGILAVLGVIALQTVQRHWR